MSFTKRWQTVEGKRRSFFSYKWLLKHITLYQKKRENLDIAVFGSISAAIFTHCQTCINNPSWQSGGIIIP